MKPELKPCPFCGGDASFDYDDNGWNWIHCKSCDASTDARVSAMDDCRPLLAEAWNRRAPAEPVKVRREIELMQALNNIDPLVRALMNRLGSGEACGGLDVDQSLPDSTTQVLLRAIDKFEERVLVGNQPAKVPLGGEILKVWDEGKGMPSRMMTNADNSCLIQFARALLEKYTAPKPRTDK